MDMINDNLTMLIKQQGLLDMFNGINVLQTWHYIKKYLESWLSKTHIMGNCPTVLPMDSTWLKMFNAVIGPANPKLHAKLKASMQIKYRGGVGELIWAMTTC
jgi:hypothetical protein